jgi:hypothetical protein
MGSRRQAANIVFNLPYVAATTRKSAGHAAPAVACADCLYWQYRVFGAGQPGTHGAKCPQAGEIDTKLHDHMRQLWRDAHQDRHGPQQPGRCGCFEQMAGDAGRLA